MNLITWSTRGINKFHEQGKLKLFLKDNRVSIIAIIEHKVKENIDSKFFQKIALG